MNSLVRMTLILTASVFLSPAVVQSAENLKTNVQPFTLKLGATRVIYPAGSAGATLTVGNPQSYPMLVRSKVFAEDKTSPAPFVVTPPLFRLDGGQQSRLRIVKTDTSQQVKGRESLNWLCVTGIPPKSGDAWGSKDANAAAATLNVQVSVGSCLKLIERPASVDGHPEDEGGKLSWRLNGGHLTVTNPTPYYMNLTNVMIGGVPVEKLDYVAPGGSRIFNVSPGAARNIVWQVVTDFGGKSRSWTAAL